MPGLNAHFGYSRAYELVIETPVRSPQKTALQVRWYTGFLAAKSLQSGASL